MPRSAPRVMLLRLLGSMPAMAETLQCRSVNGNVSCAGDGAASCQTVNGRSTCVSGGGGIVQEFGGTTGRATLSEADDGPDERAKIRPAVRTRRLSIEQRGPAAFSR